MVLGPLNPCSPLYSTVYARDSPHSAPSRSPSRRSLLRSPAALPQVPSTERQCPRRPPCIPSPAGSSLRRGDRRISRPSPLRLRGLAAFPLRSVPAQTAKAKPPSHKASKGKSREERGTDTSSPATSPRQRPHPEELMDGFLTPASLKTPRQQEPAFPPLRLRASARKLPLPITQPGTDLAQRRRGAEKTDRLRSGSSSRPSRLRVRHVPLRTRAAGFRCGGGRVASPGGDGAAPRGVTRPTASTSCHPDILSAPGPSLAPFASLRELIPHLTPRPHPIPSAG